MTTETTSGKAPYQHWDKSRGSWYIVHQTKGGHRVHDYGNGFYTVPALVGHDVSREPGRVGLAVHGGRVCLEDESTPCQMSRTVLMGWGRLSGDAYNVAPDVAVPAVVMQWVAEHSGATL